MTLLAAPALPLHTAGKYVAAAYIVFVLMLIVYLGVMTLRASRTRQDLSELRREVAERRAGKELNAPPEVESTPDGGRRPEAEREPAL